jgi:hypothetical protein
MALILKIKYAYYRPDCQNKTMQVARNLNIDPHWICGII